jgi:L-ribulose-5-phosphate 3-epimerase
MPMFPTRREFLTTAVAGTAALGLNGAVRAQEQAPAAGRTFSISLAAWSLHRTIGNGEDKIPMLEMPRLARDEFGIDAIELVSGMLPSEEPDYLAALAANAAEHDIKILLIMIDGQGNVGSRGEDHRQQAVENHCRWIDHAAYFGCHSIRMNWGGAQRGTEHDDALLAEFIGRSVEPFRQICDYGDARGINVLIENHGGPSSYPHAMEQLMAAVDHPRFGTLPDFGNFPGDVDIYDGIDRLMPFAKAVSAKCYHFDGDTGLETRLDFPRLIEIVCDKHGYDGYIGIEYEGREMSELEGVHAAKALLERLRTT